MSNNVQFWHMQLSQGEERSYSPEEVKKIVEKHQVIGFDLWEEPIEEVNPELCNKPLNEWGDLKVIDQIKAKIKEKGATSGEFDAIKDFLNRMKVGDIVLVRAGQTPVALVEVIGDYFMSDEKDEEDQPWFRHRRKVKIWGFFDEDRDKLGLSEKFPISRGTLRILIGKNSTKSFKYIEEWWNKKKGGF